MLTRSLASVSAAMLLALALASCGGSEGSDESSSPDASGSAGSDPTDAESSTATEPPSGGEFRCPDIAQIHAALGSDYVVNPAVDGKDVCAYAIMQPDGQSSSDGVVVQHPIIEDVVGEEHDLAWWRATIDATFGEAVRDAPEFGDGAFIRDYPGDTCDIYAWAPDGRTVDIMAANYSGEATDDLCDRAGAVLSIINGS